MYSNNVYTFRWEKAKPRQEVWPKDISKNNVNQDKPLMKSRSTTENAHEVPVNADH